MSKEQAEVPEEFKGFITETAVDGVVTETHGEHNARKDPDWPQFADQDDNDEDDDGDEDDDDLTPDDVEEIIEDDDDDDDEDDDADDDDADDDDADDDDDEPPAKPKGKKRKSASARIAELTREKHAEREAREALEAEVAALKAGKTPDTPPPAEDKEPEPDLSDLVKPDPADEKYTFGEIDAQYMEDMAEYNAEKAFRKRQAKADADQAKKAQDAANKQAVEALEKNFVDNVLEPGKTLFNDFEEVVIEGGKAGDYQLTPTLVYLISESDQGAKIMYHFASNPDEAEKVAKLPVERQAAYFGRMEARFSSEKDAGKKRRAEPSKAPKPGKRRARGSGKGTRTNPATTDFSAFEKLANSK